jgi:hypothetical protein
VRIVTKYMTFCGEGVRPGLYVFMYIYELCNACMVLNVFECTMYIITLQKYKHYVSIRKKCFIIHFVVM